MKKIYQAPATTVVNVKLQQMINTSDEFNKSLGAQGTGGSGTKALGRGGSIWDDDED